jgi:hypothetical protein
MRRDPVPSGTRDIDSTPPADYEILPAGAHLLRCDIDGLEAGSAEAIELHAGGMPVPARRERSGLGDARALLADRRHATHDHVVDLRGIEVVALLQLLQHSGQQRDRLHLVQRAVLLALAARRAQRVENHRFGHPQPPIFLPARASGRSLPS